MGSYLKKVIDKLLANHTLNILSAHRYQIKEAIENKINEIIDKLTEQKFKESAKNKSLISMGEEFVLGDSISLLQVSADNFDKHLYEKAGKMNKEEIDFAGRINTLENVHWWFRNPEMSGFCIQGWKKQKFYPDFIVKTKSGNYIVLEYKGEHLATNEDSDYKKALGAEWEKLGKEGCYFRWVERSIMEIVISEISEL